MCDRWQPESRDGEALFQGAPSASSHLEQTRRAHAGANTHRHHHVPDAAALAFDQRMAYQPGARHAKGVPDGNAAAVDIEDTLLMPRRSRQ